MKSPIKQTSRRSIQESFSKFTSTGKAASSKQEMGTNIDEITKIIGYITEEHKCVHNHFSGILYAGPLALVFLGRIFFFEWTVVIKWEDVVHVTKNEQGIRVEARAPKTGIYDFEQLFNPEKVWSTLVSLHNDSIIDTKRRPEPTPRQVIRSLRRMNSDPLKISQVFDFSEPPTALTGDIFSPKTRKDNMSRTVSAPMYPEVAAPAAGSLDSSDSSSKMSKAVLTNKWSDILDEVAAYSETAVAGRELPCDLDTFFDHFVRDNAEYSFRTFMRGTGDEDIDCTVWKKQSADNFAQSRVIEYTHPVNAPMAPPKARARKEQTLKRFGKLGLVIETKTFVSDVPMTDCFYVADVVRVEAIEDRVSINMHFEITFVKSTMFKSIITRTTKGEIHGFMQNFANFMAKSLGEAAISTPLPEQPIQQYPSSGVLTTTLYQKFIILFCISILVLQVWMLMEMRMMRMAMLDFQTTAGGGSGGGGTECIRPVAPMDELI